jgi:hypothetical protein
MSMGMWVRLFVIVSSLFLFGREASAQAPALVATYVSVHTAPDESFITLLRRANHSDVPIPSDQRVSLAVALRAFDTMSVSAPVRVHPLALLCANAGRDGAFRLRYRLHHRAYRISLPMCRGNMEEWLSLSPSAAMDRLRSLLPEGASLARVWISIRDRRAVNIPAQTTPSSPRTPESEDASITSPEQKPQPVLESVHPRVSAHASLRTRVQVICSSVAFALMHERRRELAIFLFMLGFMLLSNVVSFFMGERHGSQKERQRHTQSQPIPETEPIWEEVDTSDLESSPVALMPYRQPSHTSILRGDTPDYGVRMQPSVPTTPTPPPSSRYSVRGSSSLQDYVFTDSLCNTSVLDTLVRRWIDTYAHNPHVHISVRTALLQLPAVTGKAPLLFAQICQTLSLALRHTHNLKDQPTPTNI